MYKLLIVDDEPVIRHGIHYAIEWIEHDVEVIGEAENSEDALMMMKLYSPDITICDIRMPGESGLTLCHLAKQQYPQMHFILISGYSDQDYLLDAIRNQAKDYLLKPIDMKKLQEAVLKACREISDRREAQNKSNKNRLFLLENLNVLRLSFIERLLSKTLSAEMLQEGINALSLTLYGPSYLLLVTIGEKENDWNLVQELEFVFKEFSPVITPDTQSKRIVIILNVTEMPTKNDFQEMTEALSRESAKMRGPIAVSPICDSVFELKDYYQSLKRLTERGIWYPELSFCFFGEERINEFDTADISDIKNLLLKAIKEQRPQTEVFALFDELMDKLRILKPADYEFAKVFSGIFDSIKILFDIRDGEYAVPGENPDVVREKFNHLYERLLHPGEVYKNSLSGRIVRFLEDHYTEKITLERLSKELFLSQSYICHLLKDKTGKGFQKWLHHFRIEAAKKLLCSTDETVEKIATRVGYNSYKLFCEHFKKICGITATEFRNQS